MKSTGTPESEPAKTNIALWLLVSRATEAVGYIKASFGAVERYRLENDEERTSGIRRMSTPAPRKWAVDLSA